MILSKTVRYKPYSNLHLLPILIYEGKTLSIDFVIDLSILANWKGESYNSILVIINFLIKKGYYESVKVTSNTLGLAKVIINIVVHPHDIFKSIVIDWDLFFILKFSSLLYYFLSIKWSIMS